MDRWELSVSRGGTVSGQLVDLTGTPIAGGEVFGWCMTASEVASGPPPFTGDHQIPPPQRRTVHEPHPPKQTPGRTRRRVSGTQSPRDQQCPRSYHEARDWIQDSGLVAHGQHLTLGIQSV
ncbi:MAG: hypothetical protein AB7O52_11185 [Planctomycetota bacterium]